MMLLLNCSKKFRNSMRADEIFKLFTLEPNFRSQLRSPKRTPIL